MLIAGIDIGTNSMRMLTADYSTNKENKSIFKNRVKKTETTRIGKNINTTKIIDEETFKLNLQTFQSFVNEAKDGKAERIYAIGTSALRDAINGPEFVSQAEKNTGVTINIISGAFEAELAFYGVSEGIEETGRLLIIDIGGGSSEFVVGSKLEGILFKKSLNIGAVRLTDRFGEDFLSMEDYIMSKLEMIKDLIERYNIKKVVGIGGTITTLSSINQAMKIYDSEKIHNSLLSRNDIQYILDSLKALTPEERKKVVGLQPSRADIIVAGASILLSGMDLLGIYKVIVSEFDNLEGMIYYYLKED